MIMHQERPICLPVSLSGLYRATSNSCQDCPYKRADKKIKLVPAHTPEEVKVICKFPEDPLTTLPKLSPNIPDFILTAKLGGSGPLLAATINEE